jgi:Spy/CpxP family protein refolding chaperone
LFLLALATVVLAAPPDPGPSAPGSTVCYQGPIGQHHRFASFLNLSTEQRDKMRDLRKRFWADTHDLRYDILQKRLDVKKLFTDPKTDDATLLAKQRELNALRGTLMDKRAQMKIEWRKMLIPEQIQKLDTLDMGGRHSHRRWN